MADTYVGLTNRVTVQAKDDSGVLQNTGGDTFILRLEQHCTVTNSYLCVLSPSHDNIPGLPTFTTMTDVGDGTYYADFTISQAGTVAVSVEHVSGSNGDWVEYYNSKDFSGTPDIARVEYQDINYNWGNGLVTTT